MKDTLMPRHIGISEDDEKTMLQEIGLDSIDALIDTVESTIAVGSASSLFTASESQLPN